MSGSEYFLDVEGVWGRWSETSDATPFIIVLSQVCLYMRE